MGKNGVGTSRVLLVRLTCSNRPVQTSRPRLEPTCKCTQASRAICVMSPRLSACATRVSPARTLTSAKTANPNTTPTTLSSRSNSPSNNSNSSQASVNSEDRVEDKTVDQDGAAVEVVAEEDVDVVVDAVVDVDLITS